jgi:hypothetical protein
MLLSLVYFLVGRLLGTNLVSKHKELDLPCLMWASS